MFIMAKLVRRTSPIEFRSVTHVFNRRSVEKGRSHDATVTGMDTVCHKDLKSQYVWA